MIEHHFPQSTTSPAQRLPNFFIVGPPKAGTTSLYNYLDQHPDIYMSPLKEPGFFSLESRPENYEPRYRDLIVRQMEDVRKYLNGPMNERRSSGIVSEWPDYLRLFAAGTTQSIVGEASVAYLWSKTAAAGIASRIPQARIMMVLRSPAERAFSQYIHALHNGHISQSFRDYVRACLRYSGEGMGLYRPFLEMGFYADQVQRYLDHFPREQIGIWFYEETKARPMEFLKEVLEFLQVDSSFVPDTSKRYLELKVPRVAGSSKALRLIRMSQASRRFLPTPVRDFLRDRFYSPPGSVKMQPADRALMLDFYRHDIHRLEKILHRDLSAWLK